ncbi:hypothetical protein GCM10029976_087530 [Kribbella albertanoniae]|uniref:Carrier domain-containing protein n=1 Tax=Kribbella albertanoniae TaxID=1266829 RepID=A0A4V2XSW6_9ACTN|nr:phosphopantetheine-binding protein [Kribbella albertanoniae]TDC35295.1 hypothetical protein E1261_01830 [Kribbella albertanoniae]
MTTDQLTQKIAAIWCDLLKVESVGPASDFFVEGGDSMDAILMLQTVNDELEVELTVEDLFRNPDLAAVVAAVETQKRRA